MKHTHTDLASLYNINMECQVNVAQDHGERVEGEFKGRQWHGFSDGLQTWKSFRIPYKAMSEPEYTDVEMKFELDVHVEGIGLTGWDWENRCSRWVAFDFDAITGHSDKHTSKLTQEQLVEVKELASQIPWVTVRKSTSGKGLHLYVFIDNAFVTPIMNHTEHAALARSILGLMSALTGADFKSKVDICGGNMWVWHRKMTGTDGLSLIKQGRAILSSEVPANWRDHQKVISGRKKRTTPEFVMETSESAFDEITGQTTHVQLDEDHRKLIKYLGDTGAAFWWDADRHMLVCHTYDLKEAHQTLNMRGIFDTMSTGKEHGIDHNCFAYPMKRGAWAVRRYSVGVSEASSWDQDSNGYTRCYLNQEPSLFIAARTHSGLEDEKGAFVFTRAEEAQKAAMALGADLNIPSRYLQRPAYLRYHKDGRLIAEFKRESVDNPSDLGGWLTNKKGDYWTRIFSVRRVESRENDVGNYDDIARHLTSTEGSDLGWVVRSGESWHEEPLTHVWAVLEHMGLKSVDAKNVIGSSVVRPWKIVNLPFQPEYPGDRRWNREGSQFKYPPSLDKDILSYPNWTKILNHVGSGLDDAVKIHPWCISNGLKTGADYLKCWIASVFQCPFEPLPYLFFYGPQGSGKSIFHEALNLLITKGYKHAGHALKSSGGFNGELKDAIICVVEEVDLNSNKQAYNLIKDWVTSLEISIHIKGRTPFLVANATLDSVFK
jgi:hypothetical protein